jgi:hypothetical protein
LTGWLSCGSVVVEVDMIDCPLSCFDYLCSSCQEKWNALVVENEHLRGVMRDLAENTPLAADATEFILHDALAEVDDE